MLVTTGGYFCRFFFFTLSGVSLFNKLFLILVFFLTLFKTYILRPSIKFYHNIYFLKLNLSTMFTSVVYPHYFKLINHKLKIINYKFKLSFIFLQLFYFVIITSLLMCLVFFIL